MSGFRAVRTHRPHRFQFFEAKCKLPECSKPFQAKLAWHNYCSQRCRQAAYRQRLRNRDPKMRTILDIMAELSDLCANAQCVEPRLVLEFTNEIDLQLFESRILQSLRVDRFSAPITRNPWVSLKHQNVILILSQRGPT